LTSHQLHPCENLEATSPRRKPPRSSNNAATIILVYLLENAGKRKTEVENVAALSHVGATTTPEI